MSVEVLKGVLTLPDQGLRVATNACEACMLYRRRMTKRISRVDLSRCDERVLGSNVLAQRMSRLYRSRHSGICLYERQSYLAVPLHGMELTSALSEGHEASVLPHKDISEPEHDTTVYISTIS